MELIIKSIFAGLKDMLRPRIVAVMFVPFFFSALLWSLIVWLSWDWILNVGFKLYHSQVIQRLVSLIAPLFVLTEDPIAFVTAGAFILVMIIPAAIITALFITSVLLVPSFVDELIKNDFPQLTKKSNSIFTGTGTSLMYSLKYFATWVVTLPLWILIPGGALIVPLLLVAWFNSRLFTWEVMTEISDSSEIPVFVNRNSRALFTLGLMTSFLYYIPFVNFIAPVITSAAFARFCMYKSAKMY